MIDRDVFYASNLDLLAAMVEQMTKIERHLATLADYAEMLRIKETGEKVYEVQGYAVGNTSNGDKCVYLYSTHPGLQYRVCTVYEERLGDLPFAIPTTAKIWDGEAAPSREGAAKKGYMLTAPAPFKVSLLPTGGTTDAGLPIHKFNRVIGETPTQAHPTPRDTGPQQAPPPDDGWDDLKSATKEPAIKQALAKANGNGKRPAWQDPRPAEEEAAARAAFEKQHAPPAVTHDDLDRIAAGDESPVAALVAEMHSLVKTAKNQQAASAITKSAEGQVAGPNAERSLTAAIKALKGMQ